MRIGDEIVNVNGHHLRGLQSPSTVERFLNTFDNNCVDLVIAHDELTTFTVKPNDSNCKTKVNSSNSSSTNSCMEEIEKNANKPKIVGKPFPSTPLYNPSEYVPVYANRITISNTICDDEKWQLLGKQRCDNLTSAPQTGYNHRMSLMAVDSPNKMRDNNDKAFRRSLNFDSFAASTMPLAQQSQHHQQQQPQQQPQHQEHSQSPHQKQQQHHVYNKGNSNTNEAAYLLYRPILYTNMLLTPDPNNNEFDNYHISDCDNDTGSVNEGLKGDFEYRTNQKGTRYSFNDIKALIELDNSVGFDDENNKNSLYALDHLQIEDNISSVMLMNPLSSLRTNNLNESYESLTHNLKEKSESGIRILINSEGSSYIEGTLNLNMFINILYNFFNPISQQKYKNLVHLRLHSTKGMA